MNPSFVFHFTRFYISLLFFVVLRSSYTQWCILSFKGLNGTQVASGLVMKGDIVDEFLDEVLALPE